MKRKRVLLGMSGGVDSSVSALLLKNEGYEVVGVTLSLSNYTDAKDAKEVCNKIGIEHISIDMQESFKKYVINNFIDCYSRALTPNPCIECNRKLKFGEMYKKAKELNCDFLATGHYAKTEYDSNYNQFVLKKCLNENKDQSYVLYTMQEEILDKVLFPLGNFKSKEEIRQIAKENNLVNVANKPDSEDICFIPDGNYKKFLESNGNIKPKPGNIVMNNGTILGKHNGLYNYTIGQRKGMGISYKEPLFVIGFNINKNELIVGTMKEAFKEEAIINNVNILIKDINIDNLRVAVNINPLLIIDTKELFARLNIINEDKIKITFEEPEKSLTPGQSAVFYLDDTVVGGGIIE